MTRILAIALLSGVFLLLRWAGASAERPNTFHSEDELEWFSRELPGSSNSLFTGSGACVECHGSDPEGIASIMDEGTDINVVDDWRATMMANSAKDPFWRAKVSHEVLVNPQLQEEIETTCTSCHAPIGHFEAMFQGHEHYSIEQMVNDSLAMDGVSCVSCHQLSPEGLGDFFSGNLHYDTNQVAYGPYLSPLASPMIESSGYTPTYGSHINDSELCAGCHTLITQTVDMTGNVTENSFVEQATYHEWVNSVYNDETSCQSCHIPRVEGDFWIAAGYDTEPRSHFGLHHMVGGNTYMIELMGNNKEDLGIDATVEQFDSVFARTTRLLQHETLELSVELNSRDSDTAFYQLGLQNLAGHKFPTGYPSRLAFLQMVVTDQSGDTLFASGLLDSEQRIIGRDPDFEPHHSVIRQPDEVQIYELVMADVNGNVTTLLNLAESPIKDNRIPPIGFTDYHFAYDTTTIAGLALSDPDFNTSGKAQGTGKDEVFYHIPLNGYTGQLTAVARVYFQSLPPRWMDEMFAESSEEIDYFKNLYNSQSPVPVMIAADSLVDGPIGIDGLEHDFSVLVYSQHGQIYYESSTHRIESVRVFALTGQLLGEWQTNRHSGFLPRSFDSGIFIVELQSGKARMVRKIMIH